MTQQKKRQIIFIFHALCYVFAWWVSNYIRDQKIRKIKNNDKIENHTKNENISENIDNNNNNKSIDDGKQAVVEME